MSKRHKPNSNFQLIRKPPARCQKCGGTEFKQVGLMFQCKKCNQLTF